MSVTFFLEQFLKGPFINDVTLLPVLITLAIPFLPKFPFL